MTIFGRQRKIGLRTKLIGLLTVVLVLISAVFLAFTYDDQSRRAETDLLEKSRVLVTEMDAMWDFISLNQNVINYTSDGGYDYKGLHCAIAGKSVAALFSEKTDYSIRFMNLNPRNIYNTPDAYEAAARRFWRIRTPTRYGATRPREAIRFSAMCGPWTSPTTAPSAMASLPASWMRPVTRKRAGAWEMWPERCRWWCPQMAP